MKIKKGERYVILSVTRRHSVHLEWDNRDYGDRRSRFVTLQLVTEVKA